MSRCQSIVRKSVSGFARKRCSKFLNLAHPVFKQGKEVRLTARFPGALQRRAEGPQGKGIREAAQNVREAALLKWIWRCATRNNIISWTPTLLPLALQSAGEGTPETKIAQN